MFEHSGRSFGQHWAQDDSFTIGVKLILLAGSEAELFINDHETSTACFLSCVALLHGL